MSLQSRKNIAVTDFTFSDEIIQLFNTADIQNENEAIVTLFHAFLLENEFCPKDVSNADIYKLMPKDWNAKGIFKIKYSHRCCPSFSCYMTCVPLYSNISVHGYICDAVCSESIDLKMNFRKYVKQKKDFSNISEVFTHVDELSRNFKDNFCLPLLNSLHATAGKKLYGFPGLYEELTVLILTLLPVESVVSLSAVNKNLHHLANSPFLWKYLFKRDFGKNGEMDIKISLKSDWKELYKKEYAKKKRKPEARHLTFPYRLPRIFNVGPDFDFDIDFDPPYPGSSFLPPLYQLPPSIFKPYF